MSDQTTTLSAEDDAAVQVLSNAGAQCGDCGDQPGDRICPNCESCRSRYVADLRAAGWAPAGESLRELADRADPQRPEISWFGEWGHQVGEWIRKRAEYAATPCDFVACESGGEPCDTHERLMAHAQGEHELCGPGCKTP